jgi:ribosomal 50S subunit-associated protein YjgA (DUF615 family)
VASSIRSRPATFLPQNIMAKQETTPVASPEIDLQAKLDELQKENEILIGVNEELSEKLETAEKSKESGGKIIVKIGKQEYVSKVPALRYENDKIVKIEEHTQEQLKHLLKLGTIFEN